MHPGRIVAGPLPCDPSIPRTMWAAIIAARWEGERECNERTHRPLSSSVRPYLLLWEQAAEANGQGQRGARFP